VTPLPKKPISLHPVRHETPVCRDFGSSEAVVTYEKAMRVHRARVEPHELALLDGRIDGAWRVSSSHGQNYVVDIVDGSGLHDTCTCPDFLGAGLGTCKHLEAVRRALLGSRNLEREFRKLPMVPAIPVLTVEAEEDLALLPVGAWTPALLKAFGLETGKADNPVKDRRLRAGLQENRGGSAFRVVHAAPLAASMQRMKQQLRDRAETFQAACAEGRAGVDVLKHPLFAYQVEGVRHLVSNGRALLADDMGLGKTVQTIAACEVLRARGEARTIVVVAPASLTHQWAREIERYAGARAAVLAGGASARTAALMSDAPYKILSYEMTWRELSRLKDLDADVLVLDEAQRAKNFRTRTAATLHAIPSRFLFVLTGTPVENRLDDLYSLLQLVDPSIFGPLWRFNLDFHTQNAKGKILGCKNLGELRARTAPVVLRRRKEEVLDQLPALTQQTRYTLLSPEQKELEESFRIEAARLMAQAERRALKLEEQKKLMALLVKARQACDALELCDPTRGMKASPKLDEFEALASEIASEGTAKILVFSEWVEMLKLAADRLDKLGIGWSMLTGDVPSLQRPALLDRFRTDASKQVLLSSDAGGVGLNLQVASYVIHLDLPWNPAKLDQRTSRAHRLGQTRGVSVTYLCSAEGIERGIEGTLAGKRAVRSAALDPSSDVEELEVQSFSLFLRQLKESLESMEAPGSDGIHLDEGEEIVLNAEVGSASEPPALSMAIVSAEETVAVISGQPEEETRPTEARSPNETRSSPRSRDRLRLARVVLEAGFPEDAVKASYEALASALASILEGPVPQGHSTLVAAIYRDLVPSGRVPTAAASVLARLHDLASLESHGVSVDPALAKEALREVDEWVQRLEL